MTTKATHTPGPWKAIAGPPEYARIDSTDERDIARCPRKDNTTRAEANAYLVAAAPELLETLDRANKLLTQCLTLLTNPAISDHIPFGLTEGVREFVVGLVGEAAIQKARGDV